MMPNRIIKESICESRGLSEVSVFADDLYKRLLTYADDYGRFNADSQIILARLYPREMHIVTIDDIEDALIELIGVGKVRFYTSTAKKEVYGCFPNWGDHQRIRESKKRNPEPDDTSVNDYYLRRFVPIELKRKIIERDGFICKECGSLIFDPSITADRLIKMGAGLFHIDHIVPVIQGGRATEENLRLLCPRCNLTRKKRFTFEEICEFTKQSAENCGENLQITALIQSNPIQNPNPNPNIYRSEKSSLNDQADEVIDHLNMRTGSKYRHSESSRKNIRARLNDGFTVQDCKDVIDKKCVEWVGTEYEKYLNTETLFRPSHFEKYLNQKAVQKKGQSVF